MARVVWVATVGVMAVVVLTPATAVDRLLVLVFACWLVARSWWSG